MNKQPSNADIIRVLSPYFPTISTVCRSVEDRVLRAVGILGLARNGERSTDFHRAHRNLFREWCDETNGLFEMLEERDGLALDCMVCNLIDGKPFLIRFGRMKDGVIRRNGSVRQNEARACGTLSSETLFGDDDGDELVAGELRVVTLAYDIENDGTLAGRPSWWVGQTALVQEQFDGLDHLAVVDRYSEPEAIAEDVRRAVAVANPEEIARWRRQLGDARAAG